jgi:uncharacterized protein (UPF0254 family)
MTVEYIYNENTINVFDTEDYGLITNSVENTIDHGSIAEEPTLVLNYFYVWITETVFPYGNITVSGNSSEKSTYEPPVETQLFAVGGLSSNKFISAWIGSGSLFEIGGGLERIAAPWVGSSGPLRLSGNALESDVNRYSVTSINTLAIVDLGAITSAPDVVSDYGLVTSPLSGGEFDYGNIEDAETLTPFGLLYAAGGAAESTVAQPVEDTCLFTISGESIIRQTPRYSGSGSFIVSGTRLQTIQRYFGSAASFSVDGISIEKKTESFVGSGVAFKIGNAEEARVYDYNESSVNIFVENDYGSVTNIDTEQFDYGFITAEIAAQLDYRNIKDTVSLYPFGFIYITGQAEESLSAQTPEDTVLFNFSGKAIIRRNPIEIGSGFINVTGNAVEKNTEDYVGIGSKFITGEADTPVSYFEIGNGITSTNGIAIEKNTESYVGVGNLFVAQGAAESVRFSPAENIILFSISGAATNIKHTESYVGSGLAFKVGTLIERFTYDYNVSSINVFTEFDLGSITEFDTELDYGNVLAEESAQFDYGNIEDLDTLYPFGTITVSGSLDESFGEGLYTASGQYTFSGNAIVKVNPKWSGSGFIDVTGAAIEKNTESYVGAGLSTIDVSHIEKNTESFIGFGFAFNVGGISESFGANPPESTTLHVISGYAIEKNTESYEGINNTTLTGSAIEKNTESYIGSGIAFNIGNAEEARVYDYNESSINLLITYDLGFITENPIEDDYGLVADPTARIDDYGVITEDEDLYPYGSVTLSGSLVESFGEGLYTASGQYTVSGTAVVKVNPKWSGSGFIDVTGAAIEKNTENYVGNGYLSAASGAAEVFGANPPENIILYTFTGSAVEKHTEIYVGEGNLFTTISSTEYVVFRYEENITLFSTSGFAIEKNTESYVGSGIAFEFGNAEEARVYDYNESSINLLITYDLGFVTEFDTEVDYGLVADPTAGIDDYGIITENESLYPFGSIFTASGAAEAFSAQTPEDTSLYVIGGSAVVRSTPRYSGLGSILVDVTSVEKNTESYVGIGSLFSLFGASESFGANPPESTTLHVFSGSAIEKNTESYVGEGSLFTTISSTEYVVFNPTEDVSLFTITGSAIEKNTESYVGSGIAFNIGTAIESVTYDYNESSINLLVTYDLGFITENPVEDDYGFVSEPTARIDDYGIITEDEDLYPYGSITLSGNILESFSEGLYTASGQYTLSGFIQERITESYTGTGSLFTVGGISESFTADTPDQTILYKFTGSATERNTESYVGSGNVFSISGSNFFVIRDPLEGTALYKIIGAAFYTQTYPAIGSGATSIFIQSTESFSAQTPEDIAVYTVSGNITESTTFNPEEDTVTYTYSGNAIERNTESYVGDAETIISGIAIERNTEVYTGTGSLFSLFGASESFGANPPESTTLHVFSGSAIEKNTEAYAGSGRINLIPLPAGIALSPSIISRLFRNFTGNAEESYVASNVGSGNLFVSAGSAEAFSTQIPENTILYTIGGSATESFVAQTPEDTVLYTFTGSAIEKNTEAYNGTGNVNATGIAVEKNTESYQGSGYLYAISGASESFGANPPESTTLHVISGVAITSNIYVYQDFITSGQATLSGSAIEKNTEAYDGAGGVNASGIAIEKHTESYVGKGELFAFFGASESFGANPPESIVLYKFVGSAVERNTESYVGIGVTFVNGSAVEKNTESYVGTGNYDLSGVGIEKQTEIYIGSGSISVASGAAEVFGANPPESTTLHVFSGFAIEKNTESYVGEGIQYLSGIVVEKNTEVYNGNGFLFTVSGASESFGANPPESTVLYVFAGSAVEKNTESYVGSGIEYLFGNAVERNTESYVGSGLETITGFSTEKNTESYVGSGNTAINGIAIEKNTESYVGTGSLFSLFGASESFGANPPESTTLHVFSGSAIEKNTESYVGEGAEALSGVADYALTYTNIGFGELFTFNGASESTTVNPVESIVIYTFNGFAGERSIPNLMLVLGKKL